MNRRDYLTVKKRESRERARAHGRCIICTSKPCPTGLVTCADCRALVSDTRRCTTWTNAVYDGLRRHLGGDAGQSGNSRHYGHSYFDHHQPVQGMVEFRVRLTLEPSDHRMHRLPYDWRETAAERVVQDIIVAYHQLKRCPV